MKKAVSPLICLLFVLTALLPVGTLAVFPFKVTFRLVSVTAFAVATAILSAGTVIADLALKATVENKGIAVITALLAPLSFVNAFFSILECEDSQNAVVEVCALVFIGCGCYFAKKHGEPIALKIVSLILSGLMILPIVLFGFISLLIGNFGQNTVVQTLPSPDGTYCAQVIDSDQGALGGNTFVDVTTKGFDALLFRIEKKPRRVYTGQWDEYRNMEIYWKDDRCLVIRSVEYDMEKQPE